MILNVMCVIILWLVLEIETSKSNYHSLEFGLPIIDFVN
jgi:hypothetical protein